MYAIIRTGSGNYYTSVVFGYYENITSENDYQKYMESIYNRYYIVLNDSKTKLVKQFVYDRANKYLTPLVLITDADTSDWNIDEKECGALRILPKELLLEMVEDDTVPGVMLQQCIEFDAAVKYSEYHNVETDTDIKNLKWASGGFHDAYIEKLEHHEDEIYILFDGTWGCKIEVWFDGDVSFCVESRNSKEYDPYWYDSAVIMQDGFVYLVDGENLTVDDINDSYCWFKGRRMKYRIIPD